MNKLSLVIFEDPGHAWLRVPQAVLQNIGVAPGDISTYSYRKGKYAYLEEDCDAPVAVKQFVAAGIAIDVKVHYCNNDSSVRKMPRHVQSDPWRMVP